MRSSLSTLCLLSLVSDRGGVFADRGVPVQQHVRHEDGRLGGRQAAPDRGG